MSIEVEVDGIGILEFPDTMSQEDMRKAILSNFTQEAPAVAQNAPVQAPEPQGGFMARAGDLAIGTLQGIVGVPETGVGLLDIPTLGRAGKGLEDLTGYDPKVAKEFLAEGFSPAQLAANKKFEEAEGVWGKTKAAIQNPSVIAQSIVQSVPSMLAGGAISKGIKLGGKLAPKVKRIFEGAIGEGAVGAGQQAEAIRGESPDRTLTPGQSVVAAGTGIATTVIGAVSGGLADKLGIADVNTLMAAARGSTTVRKKLVKSIVLGAFQEGFAEEFPQSVQERMQFNIATGKPIWEGVDEAAVLGALTGMGMGGGAQVVAKAGDSNFLPPEQQTVLEPQEISPTEQAYQSLDAPTQEGELPAASTPLEEEAAVVERVEPTVEEVRAPAEEKIPLGLNRPDIEDASLRTLSEQEFDQHYRDVRKAVDDAEKFFDTVDNPDQLTTEQRQRIASAQDRWSAAELELFRRDYSDVHTEDLTRKMIDLADIGYNFQQFKVLADILRERGGATDADAVGMFRMLPERLLNNPDFQEATEGKLAKFRSWLERYKKEVVTEPSAQRAAPPVEQQAPAVKESLTDQPAPVVAKSAPTEDTAPDIGAKRIGDKLQKRLDEFEDAYRERPEMLRSLAENVVQEEIRSNDAWGDWYTDKTKTMDLGDAAEMASKAQKKATDEVLSEFQRRLDAKQKAEQDAANERQRQWDEARMKREKEEADSKARQKSEDENAEASRILKQWGVSKNSVSEQLAELESARDTATTNREKSPFSGKEFWPEKSQKAAAIYQRQIDELRKKAEEFSKWTSIRDQKALERVKLPKPAPTREAKTVGAAGQGEQPPPSPVSKPVAAEPEPQAQGGAELIGFGGAISKEFEPARTTSTGIKNAKVDEERQARGLSPILRPSRLKNAVVWDRVMAKIDKEPGWQDQLIEELKKKTRNISQDEVLALDHRYVDLQNEYAKATRDGAQAYADKFQSGVDEAKARIEFYEGKLSELEKIAQETGSEWGRSGQMRQRLMKEDFTLEAMEARLRAQKNFEPLTDAERLQISELHRKLAETQAEAAAAADKSNARILILQAEKALADARAMSVQQPSYAPGVLKMAENFATFMDKKADLARARLREKLSRMSAGVDPTILADVAIIGAAKITRGTLDFARWSREMAGELGDWIKPHLDAAWEASQKLYEEDLGKYAATKKLPKEKVKQATEAKADIQSRIEQAKEEIKAKATEEGANLHTPTKKLVKAIVEQNPNIGRDELIDAVHEALRESVPDISRTDAMAAMVDPKRKRPDISTDVETMRLRGKLAKIKSEYNLILSQERAKRLSRGKKILRGLQRSRGAVVNIASSFDFSAMRQALPALLANSTRVTRPQLIGRAFRDMFIGWAKESTALRIEQQILNRENHLNGLDAKVEYTSLTTEVFTKYEENAHSILDEWAALELRTGKLPKTVATLLPKLGARGVRMSNRAFSTFLNRTRADLFDELMRANFKDRAPTQTEADAVANMVNIATGRGKLGPKTGQVLSEAIWAPKLLSSRVQAMTGQPFYQGNAKTRQVVAKEYARMLIGGSMLYFVSRMFDEKDEEDPTSSDYGKIVRGDTRVDPWGGFQQVTVVGARAATGKTKSISGKIHSAGADRKYGERGIWYVLADFGRSKLRPDVATAVDVVTRTRFTGEPTTVKSVAEGLLVPLPLRDVKAIMEDRGMTEGAILETLNIFGAGVSHYDNTPREKASGK